MDFGRIEQPEKIDFSFQNEPIGNKNRLLDFKNKQSSPKVFLGGTGWTVKEWKGNVYPKKIKADQYLEYYSKQFGTIEFNTTHYRIPSHEQVEKWYLKAQGDFRFCPKILQGISHRAFSPRSEELMKSFTDSILLLKEKIGCAFMQLPPYFGPDKWESLQTFLTNTKSPLPLAIEFRHEDWFLDPIQFNKQVNWLHQNGFHTCITDVSGRRDVLHLQVAGNIVCIRFVGSGKDQIDLPRLDNWINKIKFWLDIGLQEVYFFLHHPNNIKAAEQSLYLQKGLNAAIPKLNCKGPDINTGVQSQMKLF